MMALKGLKSKLLNSNFLWYPFVCDLNLIHYSLLFQQKEFVCGYFSSPWSYVFLKKCG